jgi:hypothetical protein
MNAERSARELRQMLGLKDSDVLPALATDLLDHYDAIASRTGAGPPHYTILQTIAMTVLASDPLPSRRGKQAAES